MANNRISMNGMAELRAALRQLPQELVDEATDIVKETAEEARAAIVAGYPEVTGALKRGVQKAVITRGFVAGALVKSTAKHAAIFEHGSQTRKTKSGTANPMPPGRVFVPVVVRKRRDMNRKLIALVQKQGFTVTGG